MICKPKEKKWELWFTFVSCDANARIIPSKMFQILIGVGNLLLPAMFRSTLVNTLTCMSRTILGRDAPQYSRKENTEKEGPTGKMVAIPGMNREQSWNPLENHLRDQTYLIVDINSFDTTRKSHCGWVRWGKRSLETNPWTLFRLRVKNELINTYLRTSTKRRSFFDLLNCKSAEMGKWRPDCGWWLPHRLLSVRVNQLIDFSFFFSKWEGKKISSRLGQSDGLNSVNLSGQINRELLLSITFYPRRNLCTR